MSRSVLMVLTGWLLCVPAHAQTEAWNGKWTAQGPQPLIGATTSFSGHVSAIAVDLTSDATGNTVYVAASSGGLWKSVNGLGSKPTFKLISDPSQPLSIGSLALDSSDPKKPPILYVASGDPANPFTVSCHTGNGILVSEDGGKTWRRAGSADNGAHPFIGVAFTRVIADPHRRGVVLAAASVCMEESIYNPGRIYASARSSGSTSSAHLGIYRSENFGRTWHQVRAAGLTAAVDIVYEPGSQVYLAAVGGEGVLRSNDHGKSWTPLKPTNPAWPTSASLIQATFGTRNGTVWTLINIAHRLRLFQSADAGITWTNLPEPVFPESNNPNKEFKDYGFLMYIGAPPRSKALLIGHRDLYFDNDVTDGSCPAPTLPGCWLNLQALHADQHAVAFVDDKTWYVGNDGGVWSTKDAGQSWTDMNATLSITEVLAVASDGAGHFAVGNHDIASGYELSNTWKQVGGGDGQITHVDGNQGFFYSQQEGRISRLFNCTASACGANKSVVDLISDAATAGSFFVPYEVVPRDPRLFAGLPSGSKLKTFEKNSAVLLVGLSSLWLVGSSHDPNVSAERVEISSKLKDEVIDFIAPVPGDPTTAYVTTEHRGGGPGGLYRISNISFAGGATTTAIDTGPIGGRLGHVAVSAHDANTLYIIKTGFFAGEHLYKRSGNTWTNVTGDIPNVAHHWIAVDPLNPNWVYVGNNQGVYMTTDGGTPSSKWIRVGGQGLPMVPVSQIRIDPNRNLVVATVGRGVWSLPLHRKLITDFALNRATAKATWNARGISTPTFLLNATAVTPSCISAVSTWSYIQAKVTATKAWGTTQSVDLKGLNTNMLHCLTAAYEQQSPKTLIPCADTSCSARLGKISLSGRKAILTPHPVSPIQKPGPRPKPSQLPERSVGRPSLPAISPPSTTRSQQQQ